MVGYLHQYATRRGCAWRTRSKERLPSTCAQAPDTRHESWSASEGAKAAKERKEEQGGSHEAKEGEREQEARKKPKKCPPTMNAKASTAGQAPGAPNTEETPVGIASAQGWQRRLQQTYSEAESEEGAGNQKSKRKRSG